MNATTIGTAAPQAWALTTVMTLVFVSLPLTAQTTGTIAGQTRWVDGTPRAGTPISVIAVTAPPQAAMKAAMSHNKDWVVGDNVVATAITDNAGRFRIQGLPPGRYHVVPGPAWVPGPSSAVVHRPGDAAPRSFSDVATIDSTHYLTVSAGGVIDNIDSRWCEILTSFDMSPADC
jgi:hypothetical protein